MILCSSDLSSSVCVSYYFLSDSPLLSNTRMLNTDLSIPSFEEQATLDGQPLPEMNSVSHPCIIFFVILGLQKVQSLVPQFECVGFSV